MLTLTYRTGSRWGSRSGSIPVRSTMKLHCDHCGAELTPDTAHVFKNPRGRVLVTFCDDHCERCWSDRREA